MTNTEAKSYSNCDSSLKVSVDAIIRTAEEYGLSPPTRIQLEQGRSIAASLIGPGIASVSSFDVATRWSGLSAFVYVENGSVTGMVGMLLLSQSGLIAVQQGIFNAIEPETKHLARKSDNVFGSYGWGVTATSKAGARAALAGGNAIYGSHLSTVPCFARAVTDDGVRVLSNSLGYQAVPWNDPGLYWIEPGKQEARR